jgi:hypothetical protein
MPTLKVYKREDLKQNMINKFFPRTLIIANNDYAFNTAIDDTLLKLNDLKYLVRVYEFNVVTNVMDLTTMDISGIEVDKVMQIVPASDYFEVFSNFRLLLGNTFFKFNMLRNQDDFLEYILSIEIHKQLTNRYRNYNINYFKAEGKIICGESFSNVGKCSVFFLPLFKLDSDEWELYDVEFDFVISYLEGLIMYREGRAQTELKTTGVDTNAEELKTDGKEMMAETLKDFRSKGFTRIGKRF